MIEIPENALVLIDEFIQKTRQYISRCEACFIRTRTNIDKESNLEKEFINEIGVFINYLHLWSTRWLRLDPEIWSAHECKFNNQYLFRFICCDTTDENYEEKYIEIPVSLYEVYSNFRDFEIGYYLNDHKYIKAFQKTLKFCLRSLELLKEYVIAKNESSLENTGKDENTNKHKNDIEIIDEGRELRCPKGEFYFTKSQAKVLCVLWKNYTSGNEFMAEQRVLDNAGLPHSTFPDLFRSNQGFFEICKKHKKQKDRWRLELD